MPRQFILTPSIVEELSDRVYGLRMIIEILITQMPNRDAVMFGIHRAEAHARSHNLPTGVLRELSDLREALDDL